MQYHDDGEKDLGPTIATMSLGGSAVMTVRMKENFYSVRKHDVTKPVLRGCQLFDERNRLKADHDRLSATEFAKSKLQFGRDAQKHTKRMCAPILTMRLRHGDMVVMHGHAIQKYYEVCFYPIYLYTGSWLIHNSIRSSRRVNCDLRLRRAM